MAAKAAIFVTGDKELDRAMRRFAEEDNKGAKKAVRQASRAASKIVADDYKRRVPVDSGALKASVTVRALKRSRVRIGTRVVVPQDKLFKQYAKRHGGKEPSPRKGETTPFYYPSVLEFGDGVRPGKRFLTKSLRENEKAVRDEFLLFLRGAISKAGRL